jgi:hypothetical protein
VSAPSPSPPPSPTSLSRWGRADWIGSGGGGDLGESWCAEVVGVMDWERERERDRERERGGILRGDFSPPAILAVYMIAFSPLAAANPMVSSHLPFCSDRFIFIYLLILFS